MSNDIICGKTEGQDDGFDVGCGYNEGELIVLEN